MPALVQPARLRLPDCFRQSVQSFPEATAIRGHRRAGKFSAAQLGINPDLIELYRERQQTISEHRQSIASYLGLRHLGDAEAAQLEQFVFEESWHLEQTAVLNAQAREFLKEQRILEPAEFRIVRIVAEQRARAREHIFRRVAAEILTI